MPEIYLSPGKRLYVEGEDIEKYHALCVAFSKGSGHGLLFLDVVHDAFTEEPAFAFWKDFSRLYLSLFAATPNLEGHNFSKDSVSVDIPDEDLNRFLITVPAMKGAEYVDQECLQGLWHEIETALREEINASGKSVADFFSSRHSTRSLLGRVCFHLAENKNSDGTPFAFLATYAHQITKEGRSQHLPLGRALEEYAGAKNKNVLLRLLAPIHKAEKAVGKLLKKGEKVFPVKIEGRTLAKTFWGKAWCDHLESFSDYENRLPRGRSYLRNGSVVHLEVTKGKIEALVQGSSLYKVKIDIKALVSKKWVDILSNCSGQIDSVIELLQGKFSSGVMKIITDQYNGLFPAPKEISLNCSCPDWADMCKHVAAVLYGVGSRLDREPELLFKLRKVDHMELINKTSVKVPGSRSGKFNVIKDQNLSEIFGIDIAPNSLNAPKRKKVTRSTRSKSRPAK